MDPARTAPENLLPLPDGMFYILLSLRQGDKHGYAIMQHVGSFAGGEVRMGPGTLYQALPKMQELGMVQALADQPETGAPDRRRGVSYRLMPLGREVMLRDFDRRTRKIERQRDWLRSLGLMEPWDP